MVFNGVPAFWNEWTKDYEKLGNFGFQSFVIVRYEDIVLHTEQVMADIAKAAHLPAPAVVHQQHGPAKSHGQSNGRAAAIQKLQSKSYMTGYTPTGKQTACSQLDQQLMHRHDYHECD